MPTREINCISIQQQLWKMEHMHCFFIDIQNNEHLHLSRCFWIICSTWWYDYLQVILYNHNRGMRKGLEHLVESPAVMPGDFVVTLKLLVLWSHGDDWQVRLLQMSNLISIRADHLSSFSMSTVLTHDDWVKFCWRSVLQEFVQATPHSDPVTSDYQNRNDRLSGDNDLWFISVPQWLMILDLQQDFFLHFKLCLERVCHL